MKKAILVLENADVFEGRSFGFKSESTGEIVFNTNMMGYQEILTDPAYCNCIIIMTYPLIGNYGVNKKDMNSKKTFVSGLVVKEYSKIVSNWQAEGSLSDFMKKYKVVGIEGVDTRYLTRIIQKDGIKRGIISTKDKDVKRLLRKIKKTKQENLLKKVSCKREYEWKKNKTSEKKAVVIDLGVSYNFLDWLTNKNLKVKVVPHDTDYKKIIDLAPELIVLSNGPGNPLNYPSIIKKVQKLIGKKDTFGLGLGSVILGIILGAKSYKMKAGHHGCNQPVRNLLQDKVYMTVQDHTYCLKNSSLKGNNKIMSLNLNDETVEGFYNKKEKVLGLHYLPDALRIK